jgi:hypothetical protein
MCLESFQHQPEAFPIFLTVFPFSVVIKEVVIFTTDFAPSLSVWPNI